MTFSADEPIEPSFDWNCGCGEDCRLEVGFSLSMGFGGINTAICLCNFRAS